MAELDSPTVIIEVAEPSLRAAIAGRREFAGVRTGQSERRISTGEGGRHDGAPARGPTTEAIGWVQWCLDHQPLVGGVIAGGVLALATTLSIIDGGSDSPSVPQPPQNSYQQGFSYGQRLDNEGYSSDEAYSACRGRTSQDQEGGILVFQMACDMGYAQ